MTAVASAARTQPSAPNLPSHRDPYYAGKWQKPKVDRYIDTISPGTGESLGKVIDGSVADAEAAIAAAKAAFRDWRRVPPLERAKMLRAIADVLRKNGDELAMIDAADCGNPYAEMVRDAQAGAAQLDFYAGLVTEMKGASIPMGPDAVNFSVREPFGVVGRIIPFNHPFMFVAGKSAAPLAAGNTIVVKPPEQAPLSSLRLAELIDGILPPGVWNLVPGGKEVGQVLASHPDVAKVALIGSVPTGRAVMKAAADTLKPVTLELGGKNALIAFPDADLEAVSAAVVDGMNFTWCGQSCGSTSRAFVHEKIYDAVLERVKNSVKRYKPGIPTDPATTMGSIVSKVQYERVLGYIEAGKQDGARLLSGGKRPSEPASGQRLLRRADGVRRRHHGHAHRQGGNLRARSSPSSNGATRTRCWSRSTRSNTGSPARSGPTISSPRIAPRRRWRRASSGSMTCRSTSSVRRSAATSSPASGARKASKSSSASRARRTSIST